MRVKTALPGVEVNAQLMPFDKMGELVTIAMSSKAPTFDIVYVIDSSIASYAKNGWLRPLDDLYAKYKGQFKLDDLSPAAMKMCTYNGKLYALVVMHMAFVVSALLLTYIDKIASDKKAGGH